MLAGKQAAGLLVLPGEWKQAKHPHCACRLLQMSLTFPTYSYGLSLSVLLHLYLPLLPLPALSAPGLRFGRGMWMDARMDGRIPRSLSLFSNLRTQLPGETMMTPPPHTQPAHQGPPAGDTLHRAVTTAVNKVSQHKNWHAQYTCTLTHIHTCMHLCTQALTHKHT